MTLAALSVTADPGNAKWLSMTVPTTLPNAVADVLAQWGLSQGGSVIETRSSWLVPVQHLDGPAMLKVARIPDEQAGYRLMSWWNGQGAAQVFASSEGALLMERGRGRRSLADMARSGQDDEACRILCQTAERLHRPRAEPLPELHPLKLWFRPLIDLAASHSALAPAAAVASALLENQRDVRPLHGDLHHGNVLDFEARGWLAIDPHGLIGERLFDFANIFTNPDLADPTHPAASLPGRLEARLAIVTEQLGIEAAAMLRWIVAWTGLSAAWFIGDGDDQGAQIDLLINTQALRLLRP